VRAEPAHTPPLCCLLNHQSIGGFQVARRRPRSAARAWGLGLGRDGLVWQPLHNFSAQLKIGSASLDSDMSRPLLPLYACSVRRETQSTTSSTWYRVSCLMHGPCMSASSSP
jgi:hypothetical protein